MAPALTIDNASDFAVPAADETMLKRSGQMRTLLLAPPSLSAHPQALAKIAEAYDRNATDIQMLDRLAMGLVALPEATYDVVLLLTDVDSSRQRGSHMLDRDIMARIVQSMKVHGRLKSQDGSYGSTVGPEQTEAILAGLVQDKDGMMKPDSAADTQTVKLSFGKKKANAAAVPFNKVEAENTTKIKSDDISTGYGRLAEAKGNGVVRATPAGVGFVDSNDDFDGGFDDGSAYDDDDDEDMDIPSQEELDRADKIDPETLLTEDDRQRPIIIRKYYPTHIRVGTPTLTIELQPRHASQIASDDVPARTVPAAWPSGSWQRIRQSVLKLTPTWRSSPRQI